MLEKEYKITYVCLHQEKRWPVKNCEVFILLEPMHIFIGYYINFIGICIGVG